VKKIGMIVMTLVVALGVLGVGYALWDKELYIDGTVNTGEVNAVFTDVFTDDDGTMNDASKDLNDDGGGTDYDHWGAASSNDPNEFGPLPTRETKDVGKCTAQLDADPQILLFELFNAYPSYHNKCWFHIDNTGTVPVMVQEALYSVDDGATWVTMTPGSPTSIIIPAAGGKFIHADIEIQEVIAGTQIDPDDAAMQGGLGIHVTQNSDELATGSFKVAIWLVQWNEYPYTTNSFPGP